MEKNNNKRHLFRGKFFFSLVESLVDFLSSEIGQFLALWFSFWMQGGEPLLSRKHQTNNLVCWKVLCKINKKTNEGIEIKTLSSRAKAHPNKPHALL